MNRSIVFLLIVGVILISGCASQPQKIDTSKIEYKNILITVNRGAFNYDTFIVNQDGVIKYELSENSKRYGNINQPGTTTVDPQEIKKLAKFIVEGSGFFDSNFQTVYPSRYKTDTSSLVIEVKIDDVEKKVGCDWCAINSEIEKKVIKLYGKEIKTFLPG